jgi:hypothetical protein
MEQRNVPGCWLLEDPEPVGMPRYYFPSWDGDRFVPDEDGLEYEGVEQARAAAIESLGEMARDRLPKSSGERVLKVRVMDKGDKPLLELRLTFEVVLDQPSSAS